MKRPVAFFSGCSRIIVSSSFWIVVRILHNLKIRGLELVPGKRPAYFAMLHKRDMDPMTELISVLARQGWRAVTAEVYFALRRDAFLPGFLSRVVTQPRWLSYVLRPLSLGPVLRFIGVRPVGNVQVCLAEEWVHDMLRLEGDVPAGDVFTPEFLQQCAAAAGEDERSLEAAPLSHLLAWRYHEALQQMCTADIILPSRRGRAKNALLQRVKQELAELMDWLAHGGSIWGAPEGQLSFTGKIGPFSAMLHRLLQANPAKTYIVPVAIVYDFMTVKRMGIFVDVAPTIEYDPQQPPQDLHALLRRTWLLSARFTCTQLASAFLVEVSRAAVPVFTLNELATHIEREAAELAEMGRHVDQRLLSHEKARKLAASYMQYAVRRGFARVIDDGLYKATISASDLTIQARPSERVGYIRSPLAYALNELEDMLSVNAPTGESLEAGMTAGRM